MSDNMSNNMSDNISTEPQYWYEIDIYCGNNMIQTFCKDTKSNFTNNINQIKDNMNKLATLEISSLGHNYIINLSKCDYIEYDQDDEHNSTIHERVMRKQNEEEDEEEDEDEDYLGKYHNHQPNIDDSSLKDIIEGYKKDWEKHNRDRIRKEHGIE